MKNHGAWWFFIFHGPLSVCETVLKMNCVCMFLVAVGLGHVDANARAEER